MNTHSSDLCVILFMICGRHGDAIKICELLGEVGRHLCLPIQKGEAVDMV